MLGTWKRVTTTHSCAAPGVGARGELSFPHPAVGRHFWCTIARTWMQGLVHVYKSLLTEFRRNRALGEMALCSDLIPVSKSQGALPR
jgi:hypothetical protein